MGRMNSALTTALMGVIGIVIIEALVTNVDTSNWNATVAIFVGTLIPIVFSACIIIGLFRYFAGAGD